MAHPNPNRNHERARRGPGDLSLGNEGLELAARPEALAARQRDARALHEEAERVTAQVEGFAVQPGQVGRLRTR